MRRVVGRRPGPVLVHAAALVFTAVAVFLRWVLDPWLHDHLPLATLYGAVALAVWLGGYRPAVVSMVAGYLACDWLFIEPRHVMGLYVPRHLIGFFTYLLSCVIIIGYGQRMRTSLRREKAMLRAVKDERRRTEQAFKEADRRKDEFLATLAHELRNPLAPIHNAVHILRLKGASASPAVARAGAVIERQVRQMTRLVDELLDASRLTRGKVQLRKERVKLAASVHAALEGVAPLIDASAHQLTVTLPPAPIHLDADPTRLTQILVNLLNNAARYTPKGGQLALTIERRGAEAMISIRDNGIGIPAQHLPHLFEMFSQVTPALERTQGGLGIGLALVRELVGLHGGHVEAKSDGPGTGTEVIVHLPILEVESNDTEAPRDDDVPASTEMPVPPAPRWRVLVVDDNHDSADSLQMMLRMMGHEVFAAHDGLAAVQAAAEHRPEVVLLDIGLPRMNGYEAAEHIRRQPWGKRMTLIALTGWGQESDRRRAAQAGFDHHMTKPVDPARLGSALHAVSAERERLAVG